MNNIYCSVRQFQIRRKYRKNKQGIITNKQKCCGSSMFICMLFHEPYATLGPVTHCYTKPDFYWCTGVKPSDIWKLFSADAINIENGEYQLKTVHMLEVSTENISPCYVSSDPFHL